MDFSGKVKRLHQKTRDERQTCRTARSNLVLSVPVLRLFAEKAARHFAEVSPDFFAHRLAAARLGQRKDEHARDDGYNQEDHAAGNAFVVFCSGFLCVGCAFCAFFRAAICWL